MQLIDEIIEILSSDQGTLTDALFKTKVLLHKIGHKELIEWVNHELNGYPTKDAVPKYRVMSAQVLVNASNGAWQINAHPIPLAHLKGSQRESLEKTEMDQSLAVLEEYAEKGSGHLQSPIPMEYNGILAKGLGNGYHISSAWCEIELTGVTQILTQVRSRLLDFVLELGSNVDNELTEDEVKKLGSTLDVENLFNNAVFGDNTTIVVGTSNKQNVNNTNIKGDFNKLSNMLKEQGVSDSDIQILESAIESDKEIMSDDDKKYGPNVSTWLETMLSKAVDTSWKIELGVASSILATALNNYYGLL
ncbi:MAG: hypothetical protein QM484_13290 [Woeseiaceae bacterium]